VISRLYAVICAQNVLCTTRNRPMDFLLGQIDITCPRSFLCSMIAATVSIKFLFPQVGGYELNDTAQVFRLKVVYECSLCMQPNPYTRSVSRLPVLVP
jgi:hypothetical protein